MLQSIPHVQSLIHSGKTLLLAGSEQALTQLPAGNWIGGTIAYFMDPAGSLHAEDRIFVTELPEATTGFRIESYAADSLQSLYSDAPENGFTFLIVPNGSAFLRAFAHDASTCDGFLIKPVAGWITGVNLADIGKEKPLVIDGRTLAASSCLGLAMHVNLPPRFAAEVEIVNIFEQGAGDTITFPSEGLLAQEVCINGSPANFAEYLKQKAIDLRLPLTANYSGSIINVSLQGVDDATGTVSLYAPVWPGISYRFAKPVADYEKAFREAIPSGDSSFFSANCILNYLHGNMEGKQTSGVTGPITFGEIGHQLLNQTLVQLKIHDLG